MNIKKLIYFGLTLIASEPILATEFPASGECMAKQVKILVKNKEELDFYQDCSGGYSVAPPIPSKFSKIFRDEGEDKIENEIVRGAYKVIDLENKETIHYFRKFF